MTKAVRCDFVGNWRITDHCDDIYNFYRNSDGLSCHRSYGYLVNPAVGEVIADWWQQSA
jgi:hypothetical protein